MTHDPMCPMHGRTTGLCLCVNIARVREDERRLATERVAAAHNWQRGTDPSDRALWLSDAVAAARGGAT